MKRRTFIKSLSAVSASAFMPSAFKLSTMYKNASAAVNYAGTSVTAPGVMPQVINIFLYGGPSELSGNLTNIAEIETTSQNSYAAAFGDPRFPQLTEAEYPKLQYHISVLAPPEPLPCTSEDELLAALRPGVDGLVIEDQGHRATFLPSVWESLPTPTLFLQHLKTKAGLSNTHWSDTFSCQRYTVEEFGSHDRQA